MNKLKLTDFANDFSKGHSINADNAADCFDAIINERNESVLESFLKAWNSKGVSDDEVYFFAKIMRNRMKRIETSDATLVELVGTGGSSIKTFNISTAAALVAAGSGLKVAKHGNRAATSHSGSADVLTALGVNISGGAEAAESCFAKTGICFMFAPKFHSLSLQLANARKRLNAPTIFNNLGPLCNPAAAGHQVVGVWDKQLLHRTASALQRLSTSRSWVVNGSGLDEITIEGVTLVREVLPEGISEFEITPEDFGIEQTSLHGLKNMGPSASAGLIIQVLNNEKQGTAAENIVLINAAAAIYIAGLSPTLPEAFQQARASLRDGAAMAKLQDLRVHTNK